MIGRKSAALKRETKQAKKVADVTRGIIDPKTEFDQVRDHSGCPAARRITLRFGTGQDDRFEFLSLTRRELRRATGARLVEQTRDTLGDERVLPITHGLLADPEHLGHVVKHLPFRERQQDRKSTRLNSSHITI